MWHVYCTLYVTYDMREQSLTDGFAAAAGHRWHLHTGYSTTLHCILYYILYAHWVLHHTVYFTIFSTIHCILYTVYCTLYLYCTLFTTHCTHWSPLTSATLLLLDSFARPALSLWWLRWWRTDCSHCSNLWLTPRRHFKYWIPSHHHTHLKCPVLWRRGKALVGGAI